MLSQELLRDLNERVVSLASRNDEILSFLYECADDFCVEQVPMQASPILQIRDEGAHVLASGYYSQKLRPLEP